MPLTDKEYNIIKSQVAEFQKIPSDYKLIQHIYGTFEDDSKFVIVKEKIDGDTFEERINDLT